MTKYCPSAPASEGALLFGRVGADGIVHISDSPITITDDLASALGDPNGSNQALRFAAPCQGDRCVHWSGKCGVPDALRLFAENVDTAAHDLPHCPIRKVCRWYGQDGPSACRLCIHAVRDGVIVAESK
jgi:hypothetical protein